MATAAAAAPNDGTTDENDDKFQRRIQRAIATVKEWDADPSLLAECRALIPLDTLMMPSSNMNKNDYERDDDVLYEGDVLLLKRLALYFKTNVMTWVNAPPCIKCGCKETSCERERVPESAEEREGGASRVEVYKCPTCGEETTTFPRYNSPRKLLETRKGRCGEYANLFGLYCRSLGFETRYINDFTDHVWTEVYVRDQWIMADSCEGVIGEPSMYEAGWGKKLSYIIGVSIDQVVDVTPRYTRQFATPEFQARRLEVCSSEGESQSVIQQHNTSFRVGLSKGRLEELDRRTKMEKQLLHRYSATTEWTKGYKEGRTSGSLAWRAARKELGKGDREHNESQEQTVCGFEVESFYPNPEGQVTIEVTSKPNRRHGDIVVSVAACAVAHPESISIVVLDEVCLGCILQSRSFGSWLELGAFVDTIPTGRIVALCGNVDVDEDRSKIQNKLRRLGGLSLQTNSIPAGSTIMFVGVVERHPKWAVCTNSHVNRGIRVRLGDYKTEKRTRLKTERTTIPRCIASRLPENIMPLQTQLLADERQKRTAFLKFVENTKHSKRYAGFVTRRDAPVFLLDESAYPLERNISMGEATLDLSYCWTTFHWLPGPLVPQEDNGLSENKGNGGDGPKFDVPIDSNFFTALLGPNLLVHTAGGMHSAPTELDTATALHNDGLVALYFSAHWCGPCRRFTPMLAEMYTHLKEEVAPFHGLEIVFVSSDRSPAEFQQYYGTMPWLAVPYQQGRMLQQQISARYGVRGIPALVVLDAMSGEIVVPLAEARADVARACQSGDDGIANLLKNTWFARIPAESQEIMNMLELSCQEEVVEQPSSPKDENGADNPYLVRSPTAKPPPANPQERIKELFEKLVGEGCDPNAAAAEALQLFSQEQKHTSPVYGEGSLEGEAELLDRPVSEEASSSAKQVDSVAKRVAEWNQDGKDAVRIVVSTAQKYLANAIREPWTSKFRTFKLSNRVFDRITRIEGGIGLLCSLGFSVYGPPHQIDFMACIPLASDLDHMQSELDRILKAYSSGPS